MEAKMFQNHAKSKVQELSQHKKILKKEVIELRKKNDQLGSERDTALHKQENLKLKIESEQQKNSVLERYIEKIENQVSVQQNMMEMISLSGMSQGGSRGGSVVGKMVGPDESGNSIASVTKRNITSHDRRDQSPFPNRLPPSSRSRPSSDMDLTPISPPGSTHQKHPQRQRIESISPISPSGISHIGNRPSGTYDSEVNPSLSTHRFTSHDLIPDDKDNTMDGAQKQKVDVVEQERALEHPPPTQQHVLETVVNESQMKTEISGFSNGVHGDSKRRGLQDDDSQKSHISELTEDRTQKAMDLSSDDVIKQRQLAFAMSDMSGEDQESRQSPRRPRNGVVVSSEAEDNKHFPPSFIGTESAINSNQDDKIKIQHEAEVGSRRKLSVAERSRMEANNKPNKVTNLSNISQRKPQNSGNSESPSILSTFSDKIIDAIDNSVIGVKTDDSWSRSNSVESKDVTTSQIHSETKLTLEQRRKMQRERQLSVLKQGGALKGAGEFLVNGGRRR